MNNVKYYSDNLAHDYDMFMPKTKSDNASSKVIKMPQKNKEKQSLKKSRKRENTALRGKVFTAVMTVFIVGCIFGNIFLRAEISKVSNQLNSVEATANQLKSEQTRLSVELEKKTSIGNLEKQAKNLGMQKQEKSQINYIFSYEEQNIEESADAQ